MSEITENSSQEEIKNNAPAARASREILFGKILFGILVIFVVLFIGGVAWIVFRGYQLNQKQSALPSLSSISLGNDLKEVVVETGESMQQEEALPEQGAADQSETKAKSLSIKVLNGGAAKGSALVLAEALKKEGYTAVTTGNTVKDYTGIVLYYASSEIEKEAMSIKDTLIKTYPKIDIKLAIKANTETTQAPISIIFGK